MKICNGQRDGGMNVGRNDIPPLWTDYQSVLHHHVDHYTNHENRYPMHIHNLDWCTHYALCQ
jgi:hypothetical protein